MTDDPKKGPGDRLARLDRFLFGELLATSDEDLLADAAAAGTNIEEIVKSGREAFERAQQAVGRKKLEAIRKEMSQDNRGKVVPFDRDRAQQEIKGILKGNSGASNKLTMAARNQGANDPDEDIDGLMEDFLELGVIKGEDPGAKEK